MDEIAFRGLKVFFGEFFAANKKASWFYIQIGFHAVAKLFCFVFWSDDDCVKLFI